jgi:hypothetical protein
LKPLVLHQPESDALLAFPGLSRILIVTDAWTPQVNGVVRTLRTITEEIRAMGKVVQIIGPDQFNTSPCPTYPEIRLAMFPGRKLTKLIDDFAPDALHIATEGPLGLAAQKYARKRNIAFTTAFHTRFAEYLAARTRIPTAITYAWLRKFHGKGSGVMVATQSLRDELIARGFANVRAWSRGVDLEAFHPDPKENWDLPHPIFAYVGRVAVENWWSATARSVKPWNANTPIRISPAPASAPSFRLPMPAPMSLSSPRRRILLVLSCWKPWPQDFPSPLTTSPARKTFWANPNCPSAR